MRPVFCSPLQPIPDGTFGSMVSDPEVKRMLMGGGFGGMGGATFKANFEFG